MTEMGEEKTQKRLILSGPAVAWALAADSAAKDTIDGNILGKSIRSTFNLGWSPKQITFGLLQSRQNVFYPVVQTVENNSGLSSLDYKSPVLAIHM